MKKRNKRTVNNYDNSKKDWVYSSNGCKYLVDIWAYSRNGCKYLADASSGSESNNE